MLYNPIFLILVGTLGFYWVSKNHSNEGVFSDFSSFKGYISSLGFLIIGVVLLLKISFLITAISLMTCSLSVLIIGLSSKRIGVNNVESLPQLLIFTILSFTISLALFFAVLIEWLGIIKTLPQNKFADYIHFGNSLTLKHLGKMKDFEIVICAFQGFEEVQRMVARRMT